MFDYLTFHDIMTLRGCGKSDHGIVDRLRFNDNFSYVVRDKATYHMKRGHLPSCALTIYGFVMEGLVNNFCTTYRFENFKPESDMFVFLDMAMTLIKIEEHIMKKNNQYFARSNHLVQAEIASCCMLLFM